MSTNVVPLPPNPFTVAIHTITLTKGTALHRIYGPKYDGNTFNPSTEKLNRFSPIYDKKGEVIPVLYAASSRPAAIYETIFHDVPVTPVKRRALPKQALRGKRYGSWLLQRELRVATLHAPDLLRFGLTLDQLIVTNSRYYPQTARWAEAIHNHDPAVAGLEWPSYRASPERAFVLFGDRVAANDLTSAGDEVEIATDAGLLNEVFDCGARIGVRVSRATLP